jgi:hypothetical protein
VACYHQYCEEEAVQHEVQHGREDHDYTLVGSVPSAWVVEMDGREHRCAGALTVPCLALGAIVVLLA